MKHIAITTINTDNGHMVAFGYNPDLKFYENEQEQFDDIIRDLEKFKERAGDSNLLINVAFWDQNLDKSSSRLYKTIDELINEFKPKE